MYLGSCEDVQEIIVCEPGFFEREREREGERKRDIEGRRQKILF